MTQLFSNNASTTLSVGINNTVTSITVANGSVFQSPTGGDFELLTLTDGTNWEVIKVTARVTNTLTVVRGFEGTAQSWNSGAKVEGRVTKASLDNLMLHPGVSGVNSIAVGYKATSTQDASIAVGANATSSSDDSIALGHQATGASLQDIAVGKSAQANYAALWQPSTDYTSRTSVVKSSAGDIFLALIGGVSGTVEPTWNTSAYGATTDDGAIPDRWVYLSSDSVSQDCIAIGTESHAYEKGTIAIGPSSASTTSSVAIGRQSAVPSKWSVAIGDYTFCSQDDSVAIGDAATVSGASSSESVAIGAGSESLANNAIAIGAYAINRIGASFVTSGMSLVRKDDGENYNAEHLYFTGSQAVVFSKEIDLKTLADDAATITIPTGATFYPDEVGLVITSASGVEGQPNVSFGITGNTTAVLASTPTTKSVAKGRDIFTPAKDGVNSLTASVKTAATGTTLLGRFYWKGILVEDE